MYYIFSCISFKCTLGEFLDPANGLNKFRSRETEGSVENQTQRAIPCGRDQATYRMVDIFDGLSEADVSSFNL